MTQEEKSLLLQDLCARLPYGVMIQIPELFYPQRRVTEKLVSINDLWHFNDDGTYIENVKPYLRPMSSMTEAEKKYISDKCGFSISGPIVGECGLIMPVLAADYLIDFYNEHHIDYRGLIEKGLALEAPEGMYD